MTYTCIEGVNFSRNDFFYTLDLRKYIHIYSPFVCGTH